MAAKSRGRGQVLKRRTKAGVTWAIRLRVNGSRPYITLGTTAEGWNRKRAEEELQNVLADIRRGIWRPPQREVEVEPDADPRFHAFASDWYARREAEGLKPRSLEYLRWALSYHLLPYFAEINVTEIGIAEIDAYTNIKLAEGRLSNTSINKTLTTLASILEVAVEYDLLDRNPASGRRRRPPETKRPGLHLEPDQVVALLEAAGELDAEDRSGRRYRRALLATLAYAGTRISECLALRWRDVNLGAGRLRVRDSKTPTGIRDIDVQPELHDELSAFKARTKFDAPDDLVFPTSTGRRDSRSNTRRRVLLRAVERADRRIAEKGGSEPLPDGLCQQDLRRTFMSWLVAEGEDPAYVMGQAGHKDPKMTLGIYAKALRSKRRRPHARRRAGGVEEAATDGKPLEIPEEAEVDVG